MFKLLKKAIQGTTTFFLKALPQAIHDLRFLSAIDDNKPASVIKKFLDGGVYNYERLLGLYYANKSKRQDIVDLILKTDINVNEPVLGHKNIFHIALENDDINLMQRLIERGADINEKNNYGLTPLCLACQKNNGMMVQFLLEFGADKDAKASDGTAPVHHANADVLKFLMSYQTNIHVRDGIGNTALHRAVNGYYKDVISLLLNAGIDIDAKNDSGDTALDNAYFKEYYDVVKMIKNFKIKQAKSICRTFSLVLNELHKRNPRIEMIFPKGIRETIYEYFSPFPDQKAQSKSFVSGIESNIEKVLSPKNNSLFKPKLTDITSHSKKHKRQKPQQTFRHRGI